MVYIFEGFIIDDVLFTITKQGKELTIEPKVFELLVCFCQTPNVPHSRDELIEKVWHQRIVSYAAINRAVSELRKILEVDPSQPVIITTVSKVGYIFNATPQIINNKVVNKPKSLLQKIKTTFHKVKIYFALLFIFLLTILLTYKHLFRDEWKLSLQDERPISALKGSAFKAKLSENGENLLFIHKDKVTSNAKLWWQGKGLPAQLISHDDFYYIAAIFASEELIYAVRFNNLQERQCEIVSVDIKTQTSKHIIECADRAITHLAYDTEQRILYFNSRSDVNKPFSIFAYYLDTEQKLQLTLPYAGGNVRGDYLLALAPTNNKLAIFEYQKNSTTRLKILDLITKKITHYDYQIIRAGSLSWFDNSNLLISENNKVVLYNIETQKVTVLKIDESIGHVSANPLTASLIYDKGYQVVNLVQYSTTQKYQEKLLTRTNYLNVRPKFANHSNKVAYLSTTSGEADIMIIPVNDNSYRTHANSFSKSIGNFHWTTDDNSLIASINNQLYLFNEEERHWRLLSTDEHYIHYVHYSSDNKIIFSSNFGGDWQIWSLNVATGVIDRLSKYGGYTVQGDIEDGVLYITKFNQEGIFRLDLKTGQDTKIIPDFPITDWAKWQKIGDDIYYSTEKNIIKHHILNGNSSAFFEHGKRQSPWFTISYDAEDIILKSDEHSTSNIWQGKIYK